MTRNGNKHLATVALGCALALACLGCRGKSEAVQKTEGSSREAGKAANTGEATDLAAWQSCHARRDALTKVPALPGSPAYESLRVEMARVRGRPMLWRRTPSPSAELEAKLAKGSAIRAVGEVLSARRKGAAALREAILREGYVFQDDVAAALSLIERISLPKLFDEPEIWLRRGANVAQLKRMPRDRQRFLPERYVYASGDRTGVAAEILHGDRVAPTRAEVDAEVIGLDLVDAIAQGGFDRIKPERLTNDALVAEVRYGTGVWVKAVLNVEGARLRAGCEELSPELLAKKQAFLAEQQPFRKALHHVREVARLEMEEKLPFDAPRNGEESEDGDLRREFDRAYTQGQRSYSVDIKRRHDVYDEKGRPNPPQVCIDFLVDTLERAGGAWYAPMTGWPLKPAPARSVGLIDFHVLNLDNRRSAASFVKMARSHGDLFEVWDNPTRIPFAQRTEFYKYLADNNDALQPLDLVIIFGVKKGKPHYHSMIVLEQDPVTGVPTLIVSNAGVPREHTIEGIMQFSPKRSIKHRIRLKRPWIELLAGLDKDGQGQDTIEEW